MTTADAKRMKALERENARLKKLVADQALDIAILENVNSKTSKLCQAEGCGRICHAGVPTDRTTCLQGLINKKTAYRYEPVKREDEEPLRQRRVGVKILDSMIRYT